MSDSSSSSSTVLSAANVAAIAQLIAQFPTGFSVDAAGIVTPRVGVKITGGKQLADLARAPKTLPLELNGQAIEIEVRVLSDKEIQNIELLVPAPTPPARTKTEGGRKVADGYDRQDPKFLQDVEKMYALRRAATIVAGVPSLEVPGATVEEQNKYLAETYQTSLLEALYAGVRALSTDPLTRASFL